jgi:hypothetical protein
MKIFGEIAPQFQHHIRQPGLLWGNDDLLVGNRSQIHVIDANIFGVREEVREVEPTMHFHIANSKWSSFTGWIREYLLPWRWKVAYLDKEDESAPEKILVCTEVKDGNLSDKIKSLLNTPLHIAKLSKNENYTEILNQEFLKIKRSIPQRLRIIHPLGNRFGYHFERDCYFDVYPIRRIRGIFSRVTYFFYKNFSRDWSVATLRVGAISEKILIKAANRAPLRAAGFIE